MTTEGANYNKLCRQIVDLGAPLAWWPMDTMAVTIAGGVITQARDYIAARIQTFPAAHRPTLDVTNPQQPNAVFAGNEGGSDGGGGLLNGLGELTWILVYKDGGSGNVQFMVAYEADGGAAGAAGRSVQFINGVAGQLGNFMSASAVLANLIITPAATLSANLQVIVSRQRSADGTTAAKTARIDGTDVAGSAYIIASDMTGVTYANTPLLIGTADTAFVSPATFPLIGAFSDVFVGPTSYTDAIADFIQQCFKSLRNTP